jgi:hypothetical protein
MSAGLLTVNGDFSQSGDIQSFAPSGTHRVRLQGAGTQNIVFASPTTSFFNQLQTNNSPTSRNLVLQSDVLVAGAMTADGGSNFIGAGTSQRLRVNGVLTARVSTTSARVAPPVLELSQFPVVDTGFTAARGINPDTAVFLGSLTTFPTSSGIRYKSVRVSTTGALSFNNTAGNFADTLQGDLVISGTGARLNLQGTTAGPLFVTGNLRTESNGVLQMTTSFVTLQVNGSATFAGGSSAGFLTAGTLRLLGDFVQAGGSSAAYQAGVGHTTEFADTLFTRSITMAQPGMGATDSRFGTLQIGTAASGVARPVGIGLNGTIQAETVVDTSAGAADTIVGNGFFVNTNGFGLNNTVIDKAPVAVSGTGSISGNTVQFRNMDPTTNYLAFTRAGGSFSVSGLNFGPTPNVGVFMLVVNNTSGASGLSTTFTSPIPAATMQAPQVLYQKQGNAPSISWNGTNLP